MPELQLPDVTLFHEQSGSGADILWLAAGDHPGHNWRRYQTPAFDDRYRSTTYDARGVGRTASGSPPPWPITTHAQDAIALIEAVCTPPVALIGLSMGSLIAVQVAHDRPDLVGCAIVTGTCVKKTGFIREWEQAEIDAAPGRRRHAARLRNRPLRPALLPVRGAGRRRAVGAGAPAGGGRLRGTRRRHAGRAVAGLPRLRLDRAAAADPGADPRGRPTRRTCRRRRGGCARWPSWRSTATSTCWRGSATAAPSATGRTR